MRDLPLSKFSEGVVGCWRKKVERRQIPHRPFADRPLVATQPIPEPNGDNSRSSSRSFSAKKLAARGTGADSGGQPTSPSTFPLLSLPLPGRPNRSANF